MTGFDGAALLPPGAIREPVVVFNKSHSGSRLLARILHDAGLFIGTNLNDSLDSWDLLPLVRYLVIHCYPDDAALRRRDEPLLGAITEAAFRRHLHGLSGSGRTRWGWKLSETGFVLPFVDAVWPDARFVHLIRDGRDVAFSNHTGPTDAFWRKVFFGRDDVLEWQGLALDAASYHRVPHLFNALHWVSSVRTARAHGAALGARYKEVRYEDLCERPEETVRDLRAFLGFDPVSAADLAGSHGIHRNSIGKFRRHDAKKIRQVLEIIGPLQRDLGYPAEPN